MKQVIQDLSSHDIKLEEVPAPRCDRGGVLVRTEASLVSAGTERSTVALGRKTLLGKALDRPDLAAKFYHRARVEGVREAWSAARARLEKPVALGYSAAGTVLKAGEDVDEFVAGDRVACAGAGYAGHAEINWVPKNLCAKVPANLEIDEAATGTVGAIAMQAVRVADSKIGERVAVIGLGLIGQLVAQILRAAGCVVWGVDPSSGRVELARELGIDFACQPSGWRNSPWAGSVRCGRGMDAVVITASTRSSEPVEMAGRLARDRGAVVIVGEVRANIPRETYYAKELQVRYSRSYGPGRYDPAYEQRGVDYPYGFVRWTEKRNLEAYLDLLATGRVRLAGLITHRFPIESARQAYDLLTGPANERPLGILFTYSDEKPQTLKACSAESPVSGDSVVFSDKAPRSCGSLRFSQDSSDPLTRPAPAGENAGGVHPLPQRGEGEFHRVWLRLWRALRAHKQRQTLKSTGSALPLPCRLPIPVGKVFTDGKRLAFRRSAPRSRVVRIGWIGAGNFSRGKLLPIVRRIGGIELAGVANSTGASAKQTAQRFGFRYSTTDAYKILDDSEIDAVLIATRHDLHGPLVRAALERGKHVFVEKPLCVNQDELTKLAQAYAKSNAILSVGFNRRFSPFARRCAGFFEKGCGPLTILYRINAGPSDRTHWAFDADQGHGPIVGELCHFVDFAIFLAAALPERIDAWRLTPAADRGEAGLQAQVFLADGSEACILYVSSGEARVPKERIEIFGQGRTAISDNFRRSYWYRDGRSNSSWALRQDKGHRQELEAFIGAVANRSHVIAPIPFEELYATTLTTFRIRESLARGEALHVTKGKSEFRNQKSEAAR